MKKILCLLLALLLGAGAFAGCSSEPEPYVPTGSALVYEGQEIIPTQPTEAENQDLVLAYYPDRPLNPYKTADFTNRTLFSLMYQGLFTTDSDYNTEPVLVRSYTVSEDMRTYTFYIDNATFSDGTRLTIQDVLASLQAAMESNVYNGRFSHVLEMEISPDGGIVFRLDASMENLPILLDIPILKASEVDADRPLGTGPYYLQESAAGLRLCRRSNWWCKSNLIVTTDAISLVEAQSVIQIRDEFEFADLGLVCADPCSDAYVDYRCDYELWDCENGTFLYLACNMQSEIFENQEMRQALTFAIDRAALVDRYYRGYARAATLPASPNSPYYNNRLAAKYSYDMDKFVKAVTDTGNLGKELVLLVNKDDTLRLRVARTIGEALRSAGFNVVMSELSSSKFQTALRYRQFDLYLGLTRLSPNMDLSSFFRTGGGLRYGMLTDAAIYSMCLQALANRGNYYNLHQTVMEDGRICPILFHTYSIHATRGLLTGLTPARDAVFYYSIGKTLEDAMTVAEEAQKE